MLFTTVTLPTVVLWIVIRCGLVLNTVYYPEDFSRNFYRIVSTHVPKTCCHGAEYHSIKL